MIITAPLPVLPIESQSMSGSTAQSAVIPAMTITTPVAAPEVALASAGEAGADGAGGTTATATTSETEVESSRATPGRGGAAQAARPAATAVLGLATRARTVPLPLPVDGAGMGSDNPKDMDRVLQLRSAAAGSQRRAKTNLDAISDRSRPAPIRTQRLCRRTSSAAHRPCRPGQGRSPRLTAGP